MVTRSRILRTLSATRRPGEVEITDSTVYTAAAATAATVDMNWCDLCELLALHAHGSEIPELDDPTAEPTIKQLLQTCITSPTIRPALEFTLAQLPEPSGRIKVSDCSACPAGTVSDDNGICQPCAGTIHGNSCDTCPVDKFVDSDSIVINAGLAIPTNTSIAVNDVCPEVFVVEVDRPNDIVTAGGKLHFAYNAAPPITATNCQQLYEMNAEQLINGSFSVVATQSATGVLLCPNGQCSCTTSVQSFAESAVADNNPLRFVMNADPTREFEILTNDVVTR